MIKLFIDSCFNAVYAISRMFSKNNINFDKLFYELKLCNRSEEYPILHHEDIKDFYFTVPTGLSYRDFTKHKLEIANFLKIEPNSLKMEYKNTLLRITILEESINYNYSEYAFNPAKGVPIGIELATGNIVYWRYNHPSECHMLIAGATGAGKSVCLRNVIENLITRKNVDLYLQDTKYMDLYPFRKKAKYYGEGLEGIEEVLSKLKSIMDERYKVIRDNPNKRYKDVFLVVEEIASFNPKENKEFYQGLGELLSKGRAAHIYVIITTQTPYADILPGILKSNINTKVGLKVNTKEASKVISGDYEMLTDLKGNGHAKFISAQGIKEIQCFNNI